MTTVSTFYTRLGKQAAGLFDGERDLQANSANLAALLYLEMDDINWAGFYWRRPSGLVLGPFQGKPACTRIPLGSGVCGTAAEQMTAVVVANVHDFDGHIVCDGASNSEVVVPLIANETLLGVLDVDSPTIARFDQSDVEGLAALAALLVNASAIPVSPDEL